MSKELSEKKIMSKKKIILLSFFGVIFVFLLVFILFVLNDYGFRLNRIYKQYSSDTFGSSYNYYFDKNKIVYVRKEIDESDDSTKILIGNSIDSMDWYYSPSDFKYSFDDFESRFNESVPVLNVYDLPFETNATYKVVADVSIECYTTSLGNDNGVHTVCCIHKIKSYEEVR